ncbi:MAG: caspase family protein [Hyphomonas sp.]|nr:caspase family protein [Hyphomonas sp.]
MGIFRKSLWLIWTCLVLIAAPVFADEIRLALVIDQTNYQNANELSQVAGASREADLVESALRDTGFNVIRVSDRTRNQLINALDDFRIRLEQAGPEAVGFVYYTGHGAQHPQTHSSYLLGTDARLRAASDLAAYGIDLEAQRDGFAATGAKAVFLVFDACRNVVAGSGFKANVKGMSRIEADADMLIAYSTDLDDVAQEGIYAPILAEEIRRQGQPAETLFANVQKRVAQTTGFRQKPWFNPRLYKQVCFAGCSSAFAGEEVAELGRALDSGSEDSLKAFLQKFPQSKSRQIVEQQIAAIGPAAPATPVAGEVIGARELIVLRGHDGAVRSAAFSPDQKRIITASGDNTAKVWDASNGRLQLTLTGHENILRTAVFSPDGTKVATASADQNVMIWDASSGALETRLSVFGGAPFSATFSSDGNRILVACTDKTAKVLDINSRLPLATLSGHGGFVVDAAMDADGSRIATASWDNTVKIWNAVSGQLLATLSGHAGSVNSVAFSPDGRTLVSGSSDGTAILWDTITGQAYLTLSGHIGQIRSVAVSRDGKLVATGSADNTARIWDAASGSLLVTLTGHMDTVYSAEFSPDSKRIITASGDKTARVWELEFAR